MEVLYTRTTLQTYANATTHTIELSIQKGNETRHLDSCTTSYTASLHVIMSHTSISLTSLRLDHRLGPTLTYPSTTRCPNDTAGVITLRLDWSPTTGEGASPLVTDGFGRGVVTIAATSCGGGGQGLQVTEATGDVRILQAETRTPKLRA